MISKPTNWIEFFETDEYWMNAELWKVNSQLFFDNVTGILGFKKDDQILNIGCGPGYLENMLAPFVKSIHSIDTASKEVNICKEVCRGQKNVTVELMGSDYTNLSSYNNKYNIILCNSVVQYYKDLKEIKSLIESARSISSPGTTMLIADLPCKRSSFGTVVDALQSVLMSIQKGYFLILFKNSYIWWVKQRRNKTYFKQYKQLSFSVDNVKDIIHDLNLDADIIHSNLSVYCNRLTIVIRF